MNTDTLKIPESFQKLTGFVCPAEFWPALGYEGEARYVAIYWEIAGDEASWSDGRQAFCGASWQPYLTLLEYNENRYVRGCGVFPFVTGGSDQQATHWIIIDRQYQEHMAWLTTVAEAEKFLRSQWPAPPEAQPMTMEEWEQLAEEIKAAMETYELPTPEEVMAAIERDQQLYQAFVAVLEGWHKHN